MFLYVGSFQLKSPTRITSTDHYYSKSKNNFSIPAHPKRRKKIITFYNRPSKRFNPNEYKLEDWMKLGLSEKQSAVILKFTKYGIYSLDKLEQIFVIPPELFELIKDSVFFPKREKKYFENNVLPPSIKKRQLASIDVNKATQEELESIKGIGAFYAKQIIRYRDKLGGYNSVNQLMEVWKMNDTTFNLISPYVFINSSFIRQLNINLADVNELKQHPYLTWNLANSIVKIRDQLGGFSSIEQLKKSKLITEEIFEKIKPYLTL